MTTTTIPAPNISNIMDLASYAGTATDGGFWNYTVLALWAVFFLISKSFSSERAILIASFLAALVAFPLALAGLVNMGLVLVFGVMTGMGAILSI